jgi:hypothetical protein
MRTGAQHRWLRRAAALAVATAAAVTIRAQPSARFRFERPVTIAAPGPQRLAIDVPLLSGAAPFTVVPAGADRFVAQDGLADLRLFDAGGASVGYLLLYPPTREPEWTAGDLLPIATTQKTSGFEADFRSAAPIDAIRMDGIAAPFLKRLVLEGSGDRERWTLLSGQGTLFDLPEEGLRQTQLAFRTGTYRYVRVTWDDTNSGRVPMPSAVEARTVTGAPSPPTLTISLPVERRPSEPRRSRYRIRLPVARLPVIALELDAAGGHVFRDAAVFEARLSGGEAAPSQLGRTTLKRIVRDGVTASALRIPIAQPSEAAVDVVVEDGVNPPLDVKSATAVFAELPWIYFEARGPLVARYGDPAASAPTYDLEAVRDSVDVTRLPDATWGEPRALAAPGSGPAPTAMLDTGAALDPATFAYYRPIPDGGPGLVALALDAAALAHSRGPGSRFADVRIIDSTHHQVPYIVERRDEPLVLDMSLKPVTQVPPPLRSEPGHSRSVYALALPYGNLPDASVSVETSARVFERPLEIGVVRPPDRRNRDPWFEPHDFTVWTHSDPATPAPAIRLSLRQAADTNLVLAVDEGDNSPLPIGAVRLLLPSYRLRFYRSAATGLQLVYGRDDIAAPRYDIALLAPVVMGAMATELTPGSEGGPGREPSPTLISPRLFWALLAIAVLVLVGIIARLARTV